MSKPEASIGRRHLLSGAAAVGIGALAATSVASGVSAEEAPPTGFGPSGNDASETDPTLRAEGLPLPEALPPLTPGAKTKAISALQMTTFGYSAAARATNLISLSGNATEYNMTSTGDGQRMVAPLGLEPGSSVIRVDFYGRITTGPANQSFYLVSMSADGAVAPANADNTGSTGTIAAGPWTRSLTTPFTTQVGVDYLAVFGVDTTKFAVGVFVQYFPPATTYVPITPYRAYDSRKSGVPNPGILPRLASRVVNIVNAIDDAGAITTANVIPSTARAVTYNLTATGTTGDNFLSIAPGNAASTTVSSINFGANQSIANAATVSLDNGTVKVFCGDNVGSSHLIIDITGYYV